MKDALKIKKKLFEACVLFVENRRTTVVHTIESSKKDLLSETKSSAGDKHETGRAMVQLEMEKAGQQLTVVDQMKEQLDKIDANQTSEIVCLGSLIITSSLAYYLSISMGKITLNGKEYYAVSSNSPIGKQLLGKRKGYVIPFNLSSVILVI